MIGVPVHSQLELFDADGRFKVCLRFSFTSVLVFIGMIEVIGLAVINSCRPPRQLPQLMPSLDR